MVKTMVLKTVNTPSDHKEILTTRSFLANDRQISNKDDYYEGSLKFRMQIIYCLSKASVSE